MLEKLNDDDIMREYVLSKMIRYNNRRRLQDESVAEHSFFVSLFCLKIISKIDCLKQEEVNKILTIAILHDAGESKTSDLPYDIKQRFKSMRILLNAIEEDYFDKYWNSYFDIIYDTNDLVHAIVKLADTYSVYQYCYNEISLGNNSSEMKEIFESSKERIDMWLEIVNEEINKRKEVKSNE